MTVSSAASPRSAIPDITAPLAGSTGSTADPDRRGGRSLPMSPSNILLELIVALLTPMFLSAGSGDLRLARLAAMETVASYGARTQAELMNIAQIIGFGLAAMDSLLLSMRPELSLTMKLRLRCGANALNRSAQQNNRMLEKRRRDNPRQEPGAAAQPAIGAAAAQPPSTSAEEDITIAASIEHARTVVKAAHAHMRAARQHAAPQPPPAHLPEAQSNSAQPASMQRLPPQQASIGSARMSRSVPLPAAPFDAARIEAAPLQAPPVDAAPFPPVAARSPPIGTNERHYNLMWATAMTAVAGELCSGLADASPAQRAADKMWAEALGGTARELATASGTLPSAAEAPDQPLGAPSPQT